MWGSDALWLKSRAAGAAYNPRTLLRFDGFTFDGPARRLLRGGQPVHLSPKAFDLLAALLAARPRALSRDELMRALWPDTFVSRTSVAQLVGELRTALDDDAQAPRFVRTVQRFGYAWAADDSAAAPGPAAGDEDGGFRLLWGTSEIALREGENVIGRAAGSAVRIASPRVSRRHARITVTGARAELEDLRSRNGTFVGRRRVTAPVALSDGDEIVIGPAVLTFLSLAAAAGPTETE
jgi:DNA-binding winged helix-turn-helix (wHTH) protein